MLKCSYRCWSVSIWIFEQANENILWKPFLKRYWRDIKADKKLYMILKLKLLNMKSFEQD